jgi:hypothetical protein
MCFPLWSSAKSSESLLNLKDLECINEILIQKEYGPWIDRSDIENHAEMKYRESLNAFRDGVLGCEDKTEKIPFIELDLSINTRDYELTYRVSFQIKDTGNEKYFEEFTDGSVSSKNDLPMAIRQAVDELMDFFAKSLYKSKGLGFSVE